MKLAKVIPLMTSLRRLCFSGNPFLVEIVSLKESEQSASVRQLLKRVKGTKSLQQFSMQCRTRMECRTDEIELGHTMNVNRGGRHGIEVESANRCISLALWPRILHRASSMKYFGGIIDSSKWWEVPPSERPRAAVVFSLLRDHANIFELFGKVEERRFESSCFRETKVGEINKIAILRGTSHLLAK